MHRVTECKASRDYRLWLRFDDGVEGSVFLGNLLELGAFRTWLDVEQFCRVAVDRLAATVVWDGGVRLDPDILYQDLLSSRAGERIQVARVNRAIG
jgi:hypothetical protein